MGKKVSKLVWRNRRITRDSIRISNRNLNVLKWSSSESDEHIQMKLEICKYLKKNHKHFYTEAVFKDGSGKCDILNADDLVIYEIYDSEKEKSLISKKKKYPFPVITINARQKFKPELIY
jgi:hypothetical protein